MRSFRVILSRVLLVLGIAALAACQNVGHKGAPVQADIGQAGQPGAQEPATAPAGTPVAAQGASVAVFLADTIQQDGWTPIQIQSGTLYVNPQPVLTREDVVGVKAGTSQEGDGLLALALSEAGARKVQGITLSHPNKRLALVVGRTMLAAPAYNEPVTTDQLVFVVGTEKNASAAARAIAGVED